MGVKWTSTVLGGRCLVLIRKRRERVGDRGRKREVVVHLLFGPLPVDYRKLSGRSLFDRPVQIVATLFSLMPNIGWKR